MLGAALYVIALVVFHVTLPPIHVWLIAALFSVLMNLVYLPEALSLRLKMRTEALIACLLISLSVLGIVAHPLCVIIAIIGHGLWDIAKHFGAGVPFFSWYTWSCATIDFCYGAALFAFYLHM